MFLPLLSLVNAERSLPARHRHGRTRTHERARAAMQFLAHKEAHGCLEAAPAPAETTAPALRLPPAAEGRVPNCPVSAAPGPEVTSPKPLLGPSREERGIHTSKLPKLSKCLENNSTQGICSRSPVWGLSLSNAAQLDAVAALLAPASGSKLILGRKQDRNRKYVLMQALFCFVFKSRQENTSDTIK